MNIAKPYEYTGDTSFFTLNYSFCCKQKNDFMRVNPKRDLGSGSIIEINPCDGLYISCANWTPKMDIEIKYSISKEFVKLYFLENGNVKLVINGKKQATIMSGMNMYFNKPSTGRVIYGAGTAIRYISILMHREYFEKLTKEFPKDALSLADIKGWGYKDYNCPEISQIFTQIKGKMTEGITSPIYYEGKIFEALSLISQKHCEDGNEELCNGYIEISEDELRVMRKVAELLKKIPIYPMQINELCKISAMSQTKLRELFKKVYGIPIGRYAKKCKLQQAIVLLESDRLSITEIASKLGYANASKFSAAFKKCYQKAPKEYRLELRSNQSSTCK